MIIFGNQCHGCYIIDNWYAGVWIITSWIEQTIGIHNSVFILAGKITSLTLTEKCILSVKIFWVANGLQIAKSVEPIVKFVIYIPVHNGSKVVW